MTMLAEYVNGLPNVRGQGPLVAGAIAAGRASEAARALP